MSTSVYVSLYLYPPDENLHLLVFNFSPCEIAAFKWCRGIGSVGLLKHVHPVASCPLTAVPARYWDLHRPSLRLRSSLLICTHVSTLPTLYVLDTGFLWTHQVLFPRVFGTLCPVFTRWTAPHRQELPDHVPDGTSGVYMCQVMRMCALEGLSFPPSLAFYSATRL